MSRAQRPTRSTASGESIHSSAWPHARHAYRERIAGPNRSTPAGATAPVSADPHRDQGRGGWTGSSVGGETHPAGSQFGQSEAAGGSLRRQRGQIDAKGSIGLTG